MSKPISSLKEARKLWAEAKMAQTESIAKLIIIIVKTKGAPNV